MDSELLNIIPFPSPGRSDAKKSSGKHIDLWELLSQIGYGNLSMSGAIYRTLRETIPDSDWKSIIVDIGEAKFFSLIGNISDAYSLLGRVYYKISSEKFSWKPEVRNEIFSLYIFVISGLKAQLQMTENRLVELEYGQSLTKVPSFRLAFDYAIVRYKVGENLAPHEELLNIASELMHKELFSLAANAYRELGILLRRANHLDQVLDMLEKSHSLAIEHNLELSQDQYRIAKGYYYYDLKEYFKAREVWNEISLNPPNGLTTASTLENFALLSEAEGDMDLALDFVRKALKISIKQDNIKYLPGECLYLGQKYESLIQDVRAAEKYLKLGAESCLRYAQNGITLSGDRKKVVDAYIDFLERHRNPSSTVNKIKDSFAFAQGKRWKDIKETFHHQLMIYHRQSCATGKALAHKLSMPPTTLYSLQNRLKAHGYQLESDEEEPHDLQSYIIDHEDMNWEEINVIFEREMMLYLYEKYGYNKLRMSKILGLSYTMIIDKTREITTLDDPLLQN